jgi:Transposase DDE domain
MDLDTFVIHVYVAVDDYCKTQLPASPAQHGRRAQLDRSEVLTLAILGQWSRFVSERAFYRFAQHHLRWAFPLLPDRSQYNRLLRQHGPALLQVGLALGSCIDPHPSYEVLDTTGVVTRDCRRRGTGWLGDAVNKGRCTRVGWYVGLHLLAATTPHGAITGVHYGPASTNDRWLAEDFLAARHAPGTLAVPGAGTPRAPRYLADGGFWGPAWQAAWRAHYHAPVLAPPQAGTRSYAVWPRSARRWLASHRQIIETVFDRLLLVFGLARDRPPSLTGFAAHLAARVALHNLCLALNQQQDLPLLSYADLIAW